MKSIRTVLGASAFALMAISPLASSAEQAGDRVLVQAKGSSFWFPGKVTQAEGGSLGVELFDGRKETVAPSAIRKLDVLKVGTAVQCNWQGKGDWYNGFVTGLKGDKLGVRYADGDKESTTLSRCRIADDGDDSDQVKWACLPTADYEKLVAQHASAKATMDSIESPYHSYGNMCIGLGKLAAKKASLPAALVAEIEKHPEDPSVDAMRFRKGKYKTFKTVKKLPAARMAAANKHLLEAARSSWAGSDIGDRAVVMKCVVTSSGWTNLTMSDTNELSGRTIKGSCAVQVATNVCVVYHDGCRQEYLGFGNWGACQYQAYDDPKPELIDCASVAK